MRGGLLARPHATRIISFFPPVVITSTWKYLNPLMIDRQAFGLLVDAR
jgi:hypothetical protein